jgi:hypothetical protein
MSPGTKDIPVIIYSGKELTAMERDQLSVAKAILSKTEIGEEQLILVKTSHGQLLTLFNFRE